MLNKICGTAKQPLADSKCEIKLNFVSYKQQSTVKIFSYASGYLTEIAWPLPIDNWFT